MKASVREHGLVLRLVRHLRPLAWTIGLLISIVFPAAYYVVGVVDLRHDARVQAQGVAARLHGLILEDPVLWKFQDHKFQLLFEEFAVVLGKTAIWIQDGSGTPIATRAPERRGPVGWLNRLTASGSAPIVFNNRTFGMVRVGLSQALLLRQTLVFLLISVATGLGLAVLVFRLPISAIRDASSRVESLLEISRELVVIQPVDSLLEHIAQACGKVVGSDSVGIRFVEGNELVLGGAWGDAREAMPVARIKIGESLSGLVAATGEALVVNDYANDLRVIPEHREAARRLGYRHFLGVPVKIGDRLLGVLSIRTRRPAGFSSDDVKLVEAFAAQGAAALENARLYQSARQASDDLLRTQEQLLQAQKMEAIGTLAGGVAHDFNNLLTVIQGRADFLCQLLQANPSLLRHADIVKKTAERAAGLTRQLLAFGRKQVFQVKVFDPNALVAGLTVMLRQLTREDIELTFIPRARGWCVTADPTQLEQVLVNLVVNARDAMPSGGRLTIETAEVELDARYARQYPDVQPGQYVMLAVSDTGTGMDAATRARIFEPFFTTKPVGEGTGLGLSIVYGIVKQSGGHISVYSEPGRGTSFKVYLPRVQAECESPAETRGDDTPPQGSETILLVEDEDDLRDLARETLQGAGYTVLDARLPDAALRMAGQHAGAIHLLLTDVIMPVMNGRELARNLAQVRPEIKVLCMSGYTDNAITSHDILDPGTVLLQKPFTPDALLREVRTTLDRRVGS